MSEAGPQGLPDDALMDLLVKQVSEGLSPGEQRALDGLDSAPVMAARQDLERATAAITLAGLGPLEAPPTALRARLEALARSESAAAPPARAAAASVAGAAPRSSTATPPALAARTPPMRGNAGWYADAACLLLALLGWLRTPPTPAPVVAIETFPPTPVVPPPAPTAAQERAALLAKAGTLKITLAATKDPGGAGVTGDAVWDPATQKGFLHFSGLAANDPSVHQYQIWIFDSSRDKRYPIDGGVFDVPANAGEVDIPIRAALPVRQLAAFAVTVEKPGGVVVSAREHIVVRGAAG